MERIFATIPAVLGGIGTNEIAERSLVFAAWRDVAGEMLNARTEPLEYIENRLVIGVADTTWKKHLEELSRQMLARLNGRLGEGTVTFIEFRITKLSKARGKQETTGSERTDLPLSVRAAADRIENEDLRSSFISAAAAYLAEK